MVFERCVAQPLLRPPGPRTRARVAGLLLPFLAALAGADAALGQTPSLPAVPTRSGHAADAAAAQASQTAQAAGAQATTVQQAPVNIAIQIIVNSPGSNPVINQSNVATSAAGAGNTGSTTQAAGGEQEATGSGGAGGTGQLAATGQNAAAQATTVQSGATNAAATTVVGSPSASPSVNQANGAGSSAAASNVSSTTQVATGSGGTAGSGAGAQTPAGGATKSQPAGTWVAQGPSAPVGGGTAAVDPNDALWAWIWSLVSATVTWAESGTGGPFPGVPALPDLGLGGMALPDVPALPGDWEPAAEPPQRARLRRADTARRERSAAAGRATASFGHALAPPVSVYATPSGGRAPNVSSSFVQNGSDAGKTRGTQLGLPVVPPATPPAGSAGSLVSGTGLLLGALFLVALQLASAASALSRRFDLASLAWRRQAYLSPLERPG